MRIGRLRLIERASDPWPSRCTGTVKAVDTQDKGVPAQEGFQRLCQSGELPKPDIVGSEGDVCHRKGAGKGAGQDEEVRDLTPPFNGKPICMPAVLLLDRSPERGLQGRVGAGE